MRRLVRARRAAHAVTLMVVTAMLLAACGGGAEDLGGPKMATDPAVIVPTAAAAMGEVTSVYFRLDRAGAPVYIDPQESLAIESALGRYAAPASAEAILTVTVDGGVKTELGAVAIGDEAWLETALTGFEPLPASYGIDPARFFDPKNGWQPLLANLVDPVFVAEEQRDGTRYHLQATAPGERISVVTAGLVDDDVAVDLWVHPVSGLVTALEFGVDVGTGRTDWTLTLERYGEPVEISPPTGG